MSRVANVLWLVAACACSGQVQRPQGWTEETHGKRTPPAYEAVFAMEHVQRLDITIAASDFAAMQADLTELLGSGGGGLPGGGEPPGGGGLPPEAVTACSGKSAQDPCEVVTPMGMRQGTCQDVAGTLACVTAGGPPGGGGSPPGGGGGGGLELLARDPIYVPVTLQVDGRPWRHVGMRYKGNSSLAGAFRQGNGKLAFRMDFDEFEDVHPEIEDQRFFGFKKLTFAPGWNDPSLIRDVYVSELLRDRGIPAAHAAFVRVFVDTGEGAKYWGLYTLLEDPSDDAMLDSQLGGAGGNLYKPSGTGADWTVFAQEGFAKKTNEEEADWSDVQEAISALHAEPGDGVQWRRRLEAAFDVDGFLAWLAVNTTIVNWDSYGRMAHNYYLYSATSGAPLRWIPWDHNLSMMDMGGLGGGGGGNVDATTEVFHLSVAANWPLINRLLADPVYAEVYRSKLEHALGGLFGEERGPTRMRALHALIAPYVVGPEGEQPGYTYVTSPAAFLDSIDGASGLAAHVLSRQTRVRAALAQGAP